MAKYTQGISVQLIATGGINYLWSTGEITPVITVSPNNTTVYIVTVTDNNNCSATDSITITVDIEYNAFLPGIFSPNGDGYNDILNAGVFVYFINIIFTDGRIEEKKGNVTLVR